jgi:hypothetical protein
VPAAALRYKWGACCNRWFSARPCGCSPGDAPEVGVVLCTRDRNHTARDRRAARQHSHRRCRVSVGDCGIDAIPDRRLRQGRTADWGSGRPKNRLGHHHQLLCWSTPMPPSGRSRRPHRAPSRSTSHLAPPHIFSPVLSPTRFQSCRKRFEVAMECVLTVGTRGWCSNSDVARLF